MNATEAEYVKFHDDKSTYTGHHALTHGREDDRGADRHEQAVAKEKAKQLEGDGTERSWDGCDLQFTIFAEDEMDGKEFLKFCKQCNLTCGKLTAQAVDIVFASVAKGKKKIGK